MAKVWQVKISCVRGHRQMNELMQNMGLGVTGVGVKEVLTLTYHPGEVVTEERVLKAFASMQAEAEEVNTPWVLSSPKVISIEEIEDRT